MWLKQLLLTVTSESPNVRVRISLLEFQLLHVLCAKSRCHAVVQAVHHTSLMYDGVLSLLCFLGQSLCVTRCIAQDRALIFGCERTHASFKSIPFRPEKIVRQRFSNLCRMRTDLFGWSTKT